MFRKTMVVLALLESGFAQAQIVRVDCSVASQPAEVRLMWAPDEWEPSVTGMEVRRRDGDGDGDGEWVTLGRTHVPAPFRDRWLGYLEGDLRAAIAFDRALDAHRIEKIVRLLRHDFRVPKYRALPRWLSIVGSRHHEFVVDIEGPSMLFTGSFAIATTADLDLEVRATEPLLHAARLFSRLRLSAAHPEIGLAQPDLRNERALLTTRWRATP